MRCDFADSLLQGYFDSELTASGEAEFESHLQDCVDCAGELVELDILRGRLQLEQLYEAAPPSFRKKIRAKLQPAIPTIAMSQQLRWRWLAAASALLVLLIAGWRFNSAFHSEDYRTELAAELIDAHLRSLQPGHLTGIRSNDGQEVKGWFTGKNTLAPPARDFANDGFALQGGRLDVLKDLPVAVLVYAHTGHLINVFVWPTRERDTSPHAGSLQGYQWIDWRKGKMEFCAISAASAADLHELQRLFAE